MDNKTIILVAVIAIVVFIALTKPDCSSNSYSIQNKVRTSFQSWNLQVQGTSMVPTLKQDDYCFCQKKESYKEGDIIAYYINSNLNATYIIHRINEITPEGIKTKGDNNPEPDAWIVQPEQIFCKI